MDLKLEIIKYVYRLKEVKCIKYTLEDWDKSDVYVFDDYEEFINYFVNNKMENVRKEVVNRCIFATLNNGKVIAYKWLCDYIITKYNPVRKYTFNEIQDIHSRGKLTPWEAVDEWESMDLCVPTNSARCHAFNNCHECLVNYASKKYEFTSIMDCYDGNKSFAKELRKKNK